MRFNHLLLYYLIALLTLIGSCKERTKDDKIVVDSVSTSTSAAKEISKDKDAPTLKISDDPENNSKRLTLIKEVIKTYGFLELPYTYHYESELGGLSEMVGMAQFNEVGIGFSRFIGVLPDTTDNYLILTSMAADVNYLYVSCVNKKGAYLYYRKGESLMDCNCLHMVEDDIYCNEYATIKEDLTLEYYYKTKYVLRLVEGQNDTICDFKSSTGYISAKEFGKIVYDKHTKRDCIGDEP